MKKTMAHAAMGIVAAWICVGALQTATAQYLHVLDRDPVADESFSQLGTISGFPTNDAGTRAWALRDTDTGNRAQYNIGFTPDLEFYRTNGWQLVWKLNIVDGPDTILDSTARAIEINWRLDNDGGGAATSRRYTLSFGRSNTFATVFMGSGPAISVPGAGTGFHTWALHRPPGTDTAALYVDGIFLTNYSGGLSASEPRFYFGSATPASTGHAEWSTILLEIPEPSALGLFTLFASVVLMVRRRA